MNRNGQLASRRLFLVSLAAGAWAALGGLVQRRLRADDNDDFSYPALGLAYIAAGGLRSRASTILDDAARTARRTGRTVGEVLAARRAADFRSGNTLILDGWMVSESEALFCAGLATRGSRTG